VLQELTVIRLFFISFVFLSFVFRFICQLNTLMLFHRLINIWRSTEREL